MSFDEIRVVFESRKRKFNSRILEKDGLLHSIDVDRKYSVVSVIVPSISHYWISIVEDNRGYNMTDAEYRYYAKKLDKYFLDTISKDYIRSIVSYPQPIYNEVSLVNNREFAKILSKAVDVSTIQGNPATSYKLCAGCIILQNRVGEISDEYCVHTDRRYSAKSYRVNLGVPAALETKELMFDSEKYSSSNKRTDAQNARINN